VLEGELQSFNKVVELYKETYQKDGLYTMILRLNQIVLRIGLRRISLAYSNIYLRDVGTKLNIPTEDVEFVVAKALRDGIIHGEIDHEGQILKVERDQNIYVTHEPQAQLDKRIRYCLGLYHEIQKAITYPDMKMNLGDFKEEELDASELINLLDFDDDM
jgi:26S proteasome regulatory subunit N3